jgi:NAD(P)-dependent dehydrogenase (short-subunit alcohol dehydrogenase family)
MDAPVILITGALTGIGRTTALAFAKEGATVAVSGRREAEGKALEAELRGLGAQAAFVQADVRREDDVSNVVDLTIARFGRLDVAVNNAGTEGQPGPVIEQTRDSYTAMFDTNVLGTLLSLKHELRVMQPRGSGSIINISSTMGERGAAISRSTLPANMPWRGSRSQRLSKPPRSASASMQSRPVRRRLRCSTGWPVQQIKRRRLLPPFR